MVRHQQSFKKKRMLGEPAPKRPKLKKRYEQREFKDNVIQYEVLKESSLPEA